MAERSDLKTRQGRNKAKRWCFTLNNPTDQESIDPAITDYMVVGDEVGEEGTRHFQGYVIFKKEYYLTGVKKLLPRAHWEVAKGSPEQNRKYCTKDGNFGESGQIPGKKEKEKDQTYAEALNADSYREGLTIVKAAKPRDYCLYGDAIERNLKKAKTRPYVSKYSMDQFNRGPLALNKTVLLCGPSNIGKTHYAAAHFKNPLICSHIDKLKQLSPDNDGIIFDDMSFKHWPVESVIHLVDQEFEREINIRYGTTIIPANTPKIFTHNTKNPLYNDEVNEEQKEAVERRIQRVNVLNNLY